MEQSQADWASFRYLIEHASKEIQKRASSYLSDEDQTQLSNSYSLKENPFQRTLSIEKQMEMVHYSWFIPIIETFTPKDRPPFIATFPPATIEKLKTHFPLNKPVPTLSFPLHTYLKGLLFTRLTSSPSDFVPLFLLPDHQFNVLLHLKKTELQQLADLLGLHDLATEINHIVRKEQIKKIKETLSKKEEAILKQLLINPPRPIFPRLHLDQWDGNTHTLKNILHHRGFNRLSKALFGCHPALLWHLCHRLDTGRAKILHRFFTDVKKETLKQTLINQVAAAAKAIREPL